MQDAKRWAKPPAHPDWAKANRSYELEQPGRQVSFDDVQNIKSGTAKPAPQ